jgi:hypothetical protein
MRRSRPPAFLRTNGARSKEERLVGCTSAAGSLVVTEAVDGAIHDRVRAKCASRRKWVCPDRPRAERPHDATDCALGIGPQTHQGAASTGCCRPRPRAPERCPRCITQELLLRPRSSNSSYTPARTQPPFIYGRRFQDDFAISKNGFVGQATVGGTTLDRRGGVPARESMMRGSQVAFAQQSR